MLRVDGDTLVPLLLLGSLTEFLLCLFFAKLEKILVECRAVVVSVVTDLDHEFVVHQLSLLRPPVQEQILGALSVHRVTPVVVVVVVVGSLCGVSRGRGLGIVNAELLRHEFFDVVFFLKTIGHGARGSG